MRRQLRKRDRSVGYLIGLSAGSLLPVNKLLRISVSTVTVNKLEESLAEYETFLEMLENALDDEKAVKVKKIEKDKSRLEISFVNLSKVYKAKYRKEALEKVTEEEFNGLDEISVQNSNTMILGILQ